MPPPDLPRPKSSEPTPGESLGENPSGASSYVSAEEHEEGDTSSSKRRRSWASYTPSAVSEDEMGPGSLDLQSHDPRPPSVAMHGMGTRLRYSSQFPSWTRNNLVLTNTTYSEFQ